VYNFTGTGKIDAKTFQVNFFQNNADLIEPGIDRTFTLTLQDLIQNQTNLNLVKNGGDLTYEGEIVDYRISPMTATADQQASQNRLKIRVNVRFINQKTEKDNLGKVFNGEGYWKLYNGNKQVSKDGTFSKNRLIDGKVYNYNADGILTRVAVYKGGKYVGDAVIEE
jgi:antitoxin component YwqK of YwqJK toxin-antitoxin module